MGDAAFGKLDFVLSPRHHLSARLNTSRYYGENNVFFDPASPVTTFAISENGQERVSTESAVMSLTSALSPRVTSHLRLQFSRDLENSDANSSLALTIVPQIGGLPLSPRRAYAHDVPRYYIQNFGDAESHPDTTEYAWFVQDTMRVTGHFALTLGVRYDLQTFNTSNLATNPLWPDTGKLP